MVQETRERIVAAAARLFHEHGYAATGIATILRDAGVNAGSLYHFFPSKDDLLLGVLAYYEDRLWPEIMAPLEAAERDPLQRIDMLMGWYQAYLEDHDCRLGCPVGNLVLEVSDTHPGLRRALARNFERWLDVVTGWLESAGDQLPADCDRRSLARFVLTTVEGGVMQARAAGTVEPFAQSRRHLRQHVAALADRATAAAQVAVGNAS